jgi:hypothetical protein
VSVAAVRLRDLHSPNRGSEAVVLSLVVELLQHFAHPRVAAGDRVEAGPIELEELGAQGGGDRGRARLTAQERDLTEELSLPSSRMGRLRPEEWRR